MFGSIAGDIIGSIYEGRKIKTTIFPLFSPNCRFTDDTVLTAAIAQAVLTITAQKWGLFQNRKKEIIYAAHIKQFGSRYPNAGYGHMFTDWLKQKNLTRQNSYANGAAMRVSPIGFACATLAEVLTEAKRSARFTHNHPAAIKGAQAIATAVFLARKNHSKTEIKTTIQNRFHYNLDKSLDEIRPNYNFDSSSSGSVPQAITAFLESSDFEDAIRKAVSLGGDTDTIACMTGGIAQAFYKKIPDHIKKNVLRILDGNLKSIVADFNHTFDVHY